MRVAVTGATGFLGSHLVAGLLARGHEPVGVVREPARGAHLGIPLRRADLADPDALREAFTGLDAVVANAAPSVVTEAGRDIAPFVRAEQQAAANVVESALAAGVPRLVHISSVAVYRVRRPNAVVGPDHPRRAPGDRWDLVHLVTRRGYPESKAAAEQVVWDAVARGLRPTVLRPGPVYGSRDAKLTARYLRAAAARWRLVPTVRLPHVHAGDVARAVAGALENPASEGRAYNVTGDSVSLLDVARAVRQQTGSRTCLLPVPVPLWLACDDATTERDLGVQYRSLAEGVRECVAPGFVDV
ncbi:MAG: NAD(P)-dependent oxidoreductase [Myxococcota bacterium]